jgi:hypothetical protein
LDQVAAAVPLVFDQVAQHLAVHRGREPVARAGQRRPQFGRILDDPVVDHADLAGAVCMWMCIVPAHHTVGGPTCVADSRPVECGSGPLAEQAFERIHPSDGPESDYVTVQGLQRDTDRVVSAVLKSAQTHPQVVDCRLMGPARNYPAHHRTPSLWLVNDGPDIAAEVRLVAADRGSAIEETGRTIFEMA